MQSTTSRDVRRACVAVAVLLWVQFAGATDDFDGLLAAGNAAPRGLWGNGEVLWVTDYLDSKLYAYARADGARLPARDVDTLSGARYPTDAWSDGETLWVSDNERRGVYAYRLADGARAASRDIALAAENGKPNGVWGDGETLWVLDAMDRHAYAYRLADGTRAAAAEFALADPEGAARLSPWGLWSDGEVFYVVSWPVSAGSPGTSDRTAYAYRDGARAPEADVGNLANARASGLWSDGTTLWVSEHQGNAKLYAYPLPARSSHAALVLLRLEEADLGPFTASATAYAAAVPHATARVTLTAHGAAGTRIAHAAADADPAAPGHQADLAVGANAIEVVVTAADGTTARTYTVTATRAAGASDDATLSALALSGIDIGAFSPATTSYRANVGRAVAETTVTATPAHAGATLAIADADGSTAGGERTVALAEGANTITVAVTAEDGTTTTYTATVTRAAAVPLTAWFEDVPAAHDGSTAFALMLRFSEALAVGTRNSLRGGAVAVDSGTLSSVRRVNGDRALWTLEVAPSGTLDVAVSLAADGTCDAGGVCTPDGRPLSAAASTVVSGPAAPALPTVSIIAAGATVPEGSAATFTLARSGPTTAPLDVTVTVTETAAMLSGAAPATVSFGVGDAAATLAVATADDAVVEAPSTVTATLTAGPGYALAQAATAAVAVTDDDAAVFAVAAAPTRIDEGGASTVTVSVSNGVVFAADQAITLSASGTATADDYALDPAVLTLAAGASAAAATVTAADDADEEPDETLTLTALHDGTAVGSATVTVAASDAPSDDATLRALALSGVDIGAFSPATTSYAAAVDNAVSSTVATATPNDAGATVTIADAAGSTPGGTRTVALAEGANTVTATVAAADGTTTRVYTVTVTRAVLPRVTITAGPAVPEGSAATFTLARSGPTTAPLDVTVTVTETAAMLSGAALETVSFGVGDAAATLAVATADDAVVEASSTVTATLTAGPGYALAQAATAAVAVSDDDAAVFAVAAAPTRIDEGGASTVTVTVSNGVVFAADQAITLSASGTATADDYALDPAVLTLAAGAASAAATVTAADDADEEPDETLTLTALHDGATVGSATVTVAASDAQGSAFDHATAFPQLPADSFHIDPAANANWRHTGYAWYFRNYSLGKYLGYQDLLAKYDRHLPAGSGLTVLQAEAAHTPDSAGTVLHLFADPGSDLQSRRVAETLTHWKTDPYRYTRYGTVSVNLDSFHASTTTDLAAFLAGPGGPTYPAASHDGVAVVPAKLVNVSDANGSGTLNTRRFDRFVEANDMVACTALPASGGNVATSGTAYNSIVSGSPVAGADHFQGALDNDHGAPRHKPDLVAWAMEGIMPVWAAPTVCSAAAMLLERALVDANVANAYNSVVVKAILMAGATRFDYRAGAYWDDVQTVDPSVAGAAPLFGWGEWERTSDALPTSPKYGAGALNVLAAYEILDAGEFDAGGAGVGLPGWDYADGLAVGDVLEYPFSLAHESTFSALLTWHRHVDDAFASHLPDYEVSVYDSVGTRLAHSDGTTSNVELIEAKLPRGDYRLAVRVKSDGGSPDGLSYGLAWIAKEILGAPANVAVSGASGTHWAVSWDARADHRYRVSVGADAAFADVVREVFVDGAGYQLAVPGNRAPRYFRVYAYPVDGEVAYQYPSAPVAVQTPADPVDRDNAALASLDLSDADIGAFDADRLAYSATVRGSVADTTVTAVAARWGARVVIADATGETVGAERSVALSEGENALAITVTAPDGVTTRTYTVAVTRETQQVAVTGGPWVVEGGAAEFTLSRAGRTTASLTVQVTVAETGAMLADPTPTAVAFEPGQTSRSLSLATVDDAVTEPASVVTVSVSPGSGFVADQPSATVTVVDDDAVESFFAATALVGEGEAATLMFTTSEPFATEQTITLAVVGGTASPADYALWPTSPTLPAGQSQVAATLTAVNDAAPESAETVTVTASRNGAEIGTATVTILANDAPPAGFDHWAAFPQLPADLFYYTPEHLAHDWYTNNYNFAKYTGYQDLLAKYDRHLPAGRGVTVLQAESDHTPRSAGAVRHLFRRSAASTHSRAVAEILTKQYLVGPLYTIYRGFSLHLDSFHTSTTADLRTFAASTDRTRTYPGASTDGVPLAPAKLLNVSNTNGGGSITTRQFDKFVEENDLVACTALRGGAGGNVTTSGLAYNSLVVGHLHPHPNHFKGARVNDHGAPRYKPDIVTRSMAGYATSWSTPTVCSAAAMLLERVLVDGNVANAYNSVAVKAILMAGATRFDYRASALWNDVQVVRPWTSLRQPLFRWGEWERTSDALPTSPKYGAGALNVLAAYEILDAGEFDAGGAGVGLPGWDYADGLAVGDVLEYPFSLAHESTFSALLTWHRHVDDAFASHLPDYEVSVYDSVGTRLAHSDGTTSNVELIEAKLPRGDYRLAVRVKSDGGSPGGLSYGLAWIAKEILGAPANVAVSGASGTHWAVSWDARADHRYRVSVGADAAFADVVREVFVDGAGYQLAVPGNRAPRYFRVYAYPADGEVAYQYPSAPVAVQTPADPVGRDNAALASLDLSDVDIGAFDADRLAYSATVRGSVADTMVTAVAARWGARVVIADATGETVGAERRVALSEGENALAITVTAPDGVTTRTYTVAVTVRTHWLTAAFEDLPSPRHDGSAFTFAIRFSEPIDTAAAIVRQRSLAATNGTVTRAQPTNGDRALWTVAVEPTGPAPVTVSLEAGRPCNDGGVCTAHGDRLAQAATATVAGPLPTVSIAAGGGVAEGAVARFTLRRTGWTGDALAVAVDVAETGSMLSGPGRAVVSFGAGDDAATLAVATEDDAVQEPSSTVTATVVAGSDYLVGTSAAAAVRVRDDDVAALVLAVAPLVIDEGGQASIRVEVANGVTFATAQTITLAATAGTASAVDYALAPTTLTLAAGADAVAATLSATDDAVAEHAESLIVAARHAGVEIGAATVVIAENDVVVSADAALSALGLSGVDIGAFAPATTDYAAQVAYGVTGAAVAATPNDDFAEVAIGDVGGSSAGRTRRTTFAVGPNTVTVTVTATDGTTTRTYTVTITRATAPWGTPLPERDIDLGADAYATGVWSDGTTMWAIADWRLGEVLAVDLATGTRRPDADITLAGSLSYPGAMWSDGTILWVADVGVGVFAFRLADGARRAAKDFLLVADNGYPSGVWSDGDTMWVADLNDGKAYAYGLADKERRAHLDAPFAGIEAFRSHGVWSDGDTLLAAYWNRGQVVAFGLADGIRRPAHDIDTDAAGNRWPIDLWSDGETLWVVEESTGRIHAYAVPGLRGAAPAGSAALLANRASAAGRSAGSSVVIGDPALRAGIASALGRPPGGTITTGDMAALEVLSVRGTDVADLSGLAWAVNLQGLDIGRSAVADLRVLAELPALEALNVDGTVADAWQIAGLEGLRRLSMRAAGLEDLSALSTLANLRVLDIGGNRIAVLHPLAGLALLEDLHAADNRIEDLSPLASLTRLRVLELGGNRVSDLHPLAGLRDLRHLDLTGNAAVSDLTPLGGMPLLRRVVLEGTGAARVDAPGGGWSTSGTESHQP